MISFPRQSSVLSNSLKPMIHLNSGVSPSFAMLTCLTPRMVTITGSGTSAVLRYLLTIISEILGILFLLFFDELIKFGLQSEFRREEKNVILVCVPTPPQLLQRGQCSLHLFLVQFSLLLAHVVSLVVFFLA